MMMEGSGCVHTSFGSSSSSRSSAALVVCLSLVLGVRNGQA